MIDVMNKFVYNMLAFCSYYGYSFAHIMDIHSTDLALTILPLFLSLNLALTILPLLLSSNLAWTILPLFLSSLLS